MAPLVNDNEAVHICTLHTFYLLKVWAGACYIDDIATVVRTHLCWYADLFGPLTRKLAVVSK